MKLHQTTKNRRAIVVCSARQYAAVPSTLGNGLVGYSSLVGVPRYTTPNRDFKSFFIGCAQIRKPYKKPAKPFQHRLRGLLYAWWSNGGHGGQFCRKTRCEAGGKVVNARRPLPAGRTSTGRKSWHLSSSSDAQTSAKPV